MNVSRGLFRLGLFATVTWIASVYFFQLVAHDQSTPLSPAFWIDGGTPDHDFWLHKVLAPPIAAVSAAYFTLWMSRVFGGAFAIWFVASSVWIALCLSQIDYSCFLANSPGCEAWVAGPFLSSTYVEVLVVTFGAPLGILALALATKWVMKGFGRRRWRLFRRW